MPRVYDQEEKRHISLEYYQMLREKQGLDQNLARSILLGLSMGDYGQVVERLLDSFGLSRSTVSRHFIEESEQKLREFEGRRLDEQEMIALFIDGKEFEKEQIVIVLGVTVEGRKIPLGFVQSHTENAKAVGGLLRDLLDRGLKVEEGILCIIDGSKGIHRAVEEVFGPYAVIQRCQWHKRENIVSYLSNADAEQYRRKINQAYRQPSYEDAKGMLLAIQAELMQKNISAARSVEEGLEEVLTLHRLGLVEWFGRSFSTTNCIENLNSQLRKYTGRVKR